ncbi:YceI family protein [Cupriavidus basilensis]
MLAAFASLAGAAIQAQTADADGRPDRYVLVPQHSSVTLDVDAFSRSKIRMRFHRMNRRSSKRTQAGLDSGRVTVTIDAASVEARPRILSPLIRGSGMLDVARYPEIRFVSTRFVRTGEEQRVPYWQPHGPRHHALDQPSRNTSRPYRRSTTR